MEPTSNGNFMFATGIENSYPNVEWNGRRIRVDEMESTGHYARWKDDFDLVQGFGLSHLRYGPRYYQCHVGPDRYDWSFADDTFTSLNQMGLIAIADLCHFGVPDWVGDFQNSDWPELFAEYAGAFARRFPWVRFYTPVNEIFVTATFSGQLGWWNERLASDQGFVTALKHLVRASLLAQAAILRETPHALFVQSESSEYFHAATPDAEKRAEFLNQKRFLSLDLSYGRDVRAMMYRYLTSSGMSEAEYEWFLEEGSRFKPHCIMGNDYYVTNEHLVPDADGPVVASGEVFGYYVITKQYFDRYRLPVMHTETNLADETLAPTWLWKEWANMLRLKRDGVPIVGFTWYSLTDQVDWDTALREPNGNVNPVGLVDLDRQTRPVGEAYRQMISLWRDILPGESICLCPRACGCSTRHSSQLQDVSCCD